MFISGVGESVVQGDGQGISEGTNNHHHEYKTADELFDLMTNSSGFDDNDAEELTTQDLVLLYQNIDIGTKLMNSANEVKKPNQYVETIVYNDDGNSDSDFSDEDVPNVFKINQERLNLFGSGSLDNILCHKFGGLQIQTPDLTTQYKRQFILNDPYFKEQLRNLLEVKYGDCKTVLPTSLLDYICSKRLDDNYDCYMDNIISYVQRTIDQLKRISNGDYLTERTKEKWREVTAKCSQDISNNILSNVTSIPFHVGCRTEDTSSWKEITHSEIDIRSLSRVLKKKLVVEVPKLIFGSLKVFSNRSTDNLVISCKREKEKGNDCHRDERLDVVVQLQRSEVGQVTAKVSSIMVLKMTTEIPTKDLCTTEILPLTYKKEIEKETDCDITTSYEMSNEDSSKDTSEPLVITEDLDPELDPEQDQASFGETSNVETNCTDSDCYGFYDVAGKQFSSESSIQNDASEIPVFKENNEATFNLISLDELRLTMHRLDIQTAVTEESSEDLSLNKRKSPVRVRIKSPYENKLFAMEEKKRKRLLEIRDRREKKKQALSENCKVTKNKYSKNTPQPSSSVTKLSITNKSFYNSIYGQHLNLENKPSKTKSRVKSMKKDNPLAIDVPVDEAPDTNTVYDSPNVTPERYGKKYINRSYYLDEAETEMHKQMQQSENNEKQTCSASTSTINNDFNANIDMLQEFIGPSAINLDKVQSVTCQDIAHNNLNMQQDSDLKVTPDLPKSPIKSRQHSAKKSVNVKDNHESQSPVSTVECRKSIEKLYDLMKKSGKNIKIEIKKSSTKVHIGKPEADINSSINGTCSGTSIQPFPIYSNPSLSLLEKSDDKKCRPNDKAMQPAAIVPKVIISSKHAVKFDTDKMKKDRRKVSNCPVVTKVTPANPLRAITQLLQEFDNVQKTRQRPVSDNKGVKRVEEIPNDVRNTNRPFRDYNFRRRSRFDQHFSSSKNIEQERNKPITPRERRGKLTPPPADVPKILYQQIPIEDKNTNKTNIAKKKIMDIIEEVKEARGEAVRGPSKFISRLNTLAQPKKIYVQAHSEDYQNKYGRNLMADRLQRLASTTVPSKSDRLISSLNGRYRSRRNVSEPVSIDGSVKAVSVPPPLHTTDTPCRPHPPNNVNAIPHRSSPRNSARTHSRPAPTACPPNSSSRATQSLTRTPIRQLPKASSFSPPQSKPHSPKLSPTRTKPRSPTKSAESPEVRKKMVAVESYVKNHYGYRTLPPLSEQTLQPGHKARVPFFPKDIDMAMLSSSSNAGEANELGSALHSMIKSMIDTSTALETFTDNSKLSNMDQFSVSGNRTESDFNIDVLGDKNLETAVENCKDTILKIVKDKPAEDLEPEKCELQSLNSKTELEILENALYNQISGAFQKRLRIKKLTLTPKQSMQKVYLLQSGDVGSLLVKSLTKLTINKCGAESFQEIETLPVLLNNHLTWDFMQIPVQKRTIGYAFTGHFVENDETSGNIISSISNKNSRLNSASSTKSDKVIQCFKGVPVDHQQENAVKVITKNDLPEDEKISNDLNKTTTESFEPILELIPEKLLKIEENVLPKKDTEILAVIRPSVENIVETQDKKPKCSKCLINNTSDNPETAEYTSSLDMLVGLLNEIQKITCQTHVGSNSNLKAILGEAALVENAVKGPCEPNCVPSIERLKKLDSKPSIYSLYISAKDCKFSSSQDVHIGINNSIYVDKEVNVDIDGEKINTFTTVSSKFLPVTLNRSTNVTNSLIGVLSEPSSQSIYSFNGSFHKSLCSNRILNTQSMKNISGISTKEIKEKPKMVNKTAKRHLKKMSTTSDNNAVVIKVDNNDISKFKVNKLIGHHSDFDPILKIKRDILVTIYSLLVLTVFAALSFPELLFIDTV